MFIKRFFLIFTVILAFTGCVGQSGWHTEYDTVPVMQPSQMQNDFYYPEYGTYGQTTNKFDYAPASGDKNVAVLLPTSGANADIGRGIAKSIEMAFMRHKYKNVSVTFFDISGNRAQKQNIIQNALLSSPDIILGPIFAEDVKMLRDMKPQSLPVLSFSSDTSAIGDGVMTMALIPAQSVEAIMKEIIRNGAQSVLIMAPQSQSGEHMAGAAVQAGNIYDMPIAGLFYYKEGNTDSIKQSAQRSAMFDARSAANNKAREILSDILLKENLTNEQKISIRSQLDKLSKSDTLGKAPYDAILFLGNPNDSKSIASFLRYFDVAPRDVNFYGTALWDTSELLNDFTMAGARFAALPPTSQDFEKLYEQANGHKPTRLDTFGFDAANLAIGMIYSNKNPAAYLLDPSGYNGLDGMFRLRPDGTSERALQIIELSGSGTKYVNRPAARDFLTPIYSMQPRQISNASEIELVGKGINPMDFIKIPEHLKSKYRSKTFGANTRLDNSPAPEQTNEIIILPEDDSNIISSEEFQPVVLEQIDRLLIDSVELNQ